MKTMVLKIQRITFIYIRCVVKFNLDVWYHQNLLTESYIALSSSTILLFLSMTSLMYSMLDFPL